MPSELAHRERFIRALEGGDIDRPPCFFRAEAPVLRRLRDELGLSSALDLARHFGTDALHVAPAWRRELFRQDSATDHFYDMFGNRYRKVEYADISSETVVEPLLAGATGPESLDRVKWPDPGILDLNECSRRAAEAHASGLAVYGGVWASIFTHSRAMLGEEDYLVALLAAPEMIAALVERITVCFLELNRAYLDSCAKYLDVYYFGSDFGTQSTLFISPEMFRTFYKPHLTSLAAQAHDYGLRVMYHTCGSVHAIIDDLIECGIDILDPVQVSASGMSAEELAARFRGRIAFHGGISTQGVLPEGGPEQVREAVRQTVHTLGPRGYIVAPDQDLMADVPAENIEALYGAVQEMRL